jgi:signal transduction histidine kinase
LGEEHKLQEYVDIILQEAIRLEKLVKQVREFMNVQSATLSMEKVPPVVDEVTKIFKPMAKRRKVRIATDIDGDTPLINMDSAQLVTALSNIVENALESMAGGGTLTLGVNRQNNNVLITVRDTGRGIPSGQLDAIYDPFVTSKTRGAGLGLTMVHQIIMNHQGEIKISSQLEKGTIVILRLPVPMGQKG